MSYRLIEDCGIIGDLHTVALVAKDGSIDFMCFPEFDSPTIFAALLDEDKGGRFQIAPSLNHANLKQLYLPDTNVLLTRFLSERGMAEVSDFMPVGESGREILFISEGLDKTALRLRSGLIERIPPKAMEVGITTISAIR